MYYVLGDDGIKEAGEREWECCEAGIGIFDGESWGKALKLKEEFSIEGNPDRIFFCRTEHHGSYLFSTFHIPVKKKEKRQNTFHLYLLHGKIIFVDEGEIARETVEKIVKRGMGKQYSPDRFLGEFLMSLIEEDTMYLAELERTIAELEETVLRQDTENFNYEMLGLKKEISRFYCYYGQMINLGEVLSEDAVDYMDIGEGRGCQLFMERCQRLQQEIQVLREYAMQVQDVYQAEIEIRQNSIMKLLTIVTTIFLPLSLIAGWYGMNFRYMPELEWLYSYPVVIGVSILIVIVSLIYFKKKKFF
ncbi:MAG: cobalt transporter [Roseburia sp.]|nr:cobalt transporter [Roseburia sp.]